MEINIFNLDFEESTVLPSVVVGSGEHQVVAAGIGFDFVGQVALSVLPNLEGVLMLKFPLEQIWQIVPQNFPEI